MDDIDKQKELFEESFQLWLDKVPAYIDDQVVQHGSLTQESINFIHKVLTRAGYLEEIYPTAMMNLANKSVGIVEQRKNFNQKGAKVQKEKGSETEKKVLASAKAIRATRTNKSITGRELARQVSAKTGIPFGTVRTHLEKKSTN